MAEGICMQPPIVEKKPHELNMHGHKIIDNYFWLRNKEDKNVIKYLNEENDYTDLNMTHVNDFKSNLFDELKGRVKERDESVPSKCGDYFYSSKNEEGKEYKVYCRRKGNLDAKEEVLLDLNTLAEKHDYLSLGSFDWSEDHNILAYSLDTDGSEEYLLKFKDLKNGKDFPEEIEKTSYGSAWAKDNKTFFYVKLNENQRPYQVWRHKLGTDPAKDKLVFEDSDNRFYISCWTSSSEDYIFIETDGVNTTEIHYLKTDDAEGEFKCFAKRDFGIEYSLVHHGDNWLISTNENAVDFKVMSTKIGFEGKENWQEYMPHQEGRMIDSVTSFKNHIFIGFKERARERLKVISNNGESHEIVFPENVASFGLGSNLEYDTEVVRLGYSSPISPYSVFDYHISERRLETKKVQEIPSGYDKSKYDCDLIYAKARDGKEVPVTLVYLKGTKLDSSNPLYLYAYGSYGAGMTDDFSTNWLSLVNRGVVCAVAHIRGGDEMGRGWYEDGKLLKKMNTFNDYIDCAKHLIDTKWTRSGMIAGCGGSAGGMLMGGVANMAGELFSSVVAHVPFVDCLNTMLDETLPLTATEYNEWGNPNEKKYFEMIKSYSPYDNVEAKDYPNLLITAGLNDPRVTYWEPAKWTAKLRELKTNNNLLLLKTNMEAGHGGKSGRFESLHEKSLEYAFVLNNFGITE
jgi:oligopeptidase B